MDNAFKRGHDVVPGNNREHALSSPILVLIIVETVLMFFKELLAPANFYTTSFSFYLSFQF